MASSTRIRGGLTIRLISRACGSLLALGQEDFHSSFMLLYNFSCFHLLCPQPSRFLPSINLESSRRFYTNMTLKRSFKVASSLRELDAFHSRKRNFISRYDFYYFPQCSFFFDISRVFSLHRHVFASFPRAIFFIPL